MKIILFLIGLFFVVPVHAQDIILAPECSVLKDHVPNSNVAYKSGVDVHGKSVVPADINSAVIDVPETMVVPLTIDLA